MSSGSLESLESDVNKHLYKSSLMTNEPVPVLMTVESGRTYAPMPGFNSSVQPGFVSDVNEYLYKPSEVDDLISPLHVLVKQRTDRTLLEKLRVT